MRARLLPVVGAVALLLMSACSGGSTPADSATIQQAFDSYVKDKMPGVTLDMVKAAAADGNVTFYATTDGAARATADEFAKRFPFIKVQTIQLAGGALTQRFESEQGAKLKSADVVLSTTEFVARSWVDKGYCGKYTPTSAAHYTQGGLADYLYRFNGAPISVGWIDGKLSTDQIGLLKTWDGVINQTFAGKKFGVVDISVGGSTTIPNTYFYETYSTSFWSTFMSNASAVTIFSGQGPAVDSLVKGEYDILAPGAGNILQSKWLTGAPVAWVTPTPTMSVPAVGCVVANAPHAAAAKLLMEFLLSKDAQALSPNYGDISYRDDMPAGDTLLSGKAADLTKTSWYQAPDMTKTWELPADQMAAKAPTVTAAWKSIVKTKA